MKTSFRQRRVRLDGSRNFAIGKRNREEHAQVCISRQLLQDIDVSADQRRLSNDPYRLSKLRANLQTLTVQLVISFQGNIRIGRTREYYLFALPRRLHQFVTQKSRGVDFY